MTSRINAKRPIGIAGRTKQPHQNCSQSVASYSRLARRRLPGEKMFLGKLATSKHQSYSQSFTNSTRHTQNYRRGQPVGAAAGRTALLIICQRVEPSARLASRTLPGTARKASIETLIIVGKIIMTSTTIAAPQP